MRSSMVRFGVVAAVVACLLAQSAVAQEVREPEGGALPEYARVYQVTPDRGPVVTVDNGLPNIMITGYWPPTNEMLRQFSPDIEQNPDGWVGENWEGRGYNIYSFFPEFPGGLGKGEGDFEVDYQDTSADFWRIVDEVQPIAIVTTGRADYDYDWELEGGHIMYALRHWAEDYEEPLQPTDDLPIADEPPATERYSTLPLQAIVDAVEAEVPNVYAYHTTIDTSNFLCNFVGYHATWYRDLHGDPVDPLWMIAAGHIHVGYRMTLEDAIEATEVTLRTLTDYLDEQPPPLPLPENSLGITDCVTDDDCDDEANCVEGTCYAPKHRYISIARNPNQFTNTARRVSLAADPDPIPLGWVGAPYDSSGLTLAQVVTAPVYDGIGFEGDWPDLLHVTGCEIATGQTYLVQAIRAGAVLSDPDNYSEPLELHTPELWGDVVSTCTSYNCQPPQGEVNIDDILAAIGAFQSLNNDPLTWFDIAPALNDGVPNQMVDIDDILATIQGFQSKAYPGLGPLNCAGLSPYVAEYSNSGCLPGSEQTPPGRDVCPEDVIEFTPGPGTLHVAHRNATYDCCPIDIAITLSVDGNTLRLTEEYTDGGCDCICCFDVESTIAGLEPGEYHVIFCWDDWESPPGPQCYEEDLVIP